MDMIRVLWFHIHNLNFCDFYKDYIQLWYLTCTQKDDYVELFVSRGMIYVATSLTKCYK